MDQSSTSLPLIQSDFNEEEYMNLLAREGRYKVAKVDEAVKGAELENAAEWASRDRAGGFRDAGLVIPREVLEYFWNIVNIFE